MDAKERQAHWNHVYTTNAEDEVSWFQERPTNSLEFIRVSGVGKDAAIIDVGGGESRLVDDLLNEGYGDISVLDVSEQAIATTKARLGQHTSRVTWIIADVTAWEPERAYDLWHDRAAFHFLTEPADRQAYVERLLKALRPGGHAIISTFALDGPERCSGLPIVRYGAASLGGILGPSFELAETRNHEHHTPMDRIQRFQFSWFRRVYA
jgi:2-polyprenyl-3-methyl-5-hydroxy-6-metoxy-1,4-benzoquinol methylase